MADPNQRADEAAVFWRADASPTVIILATATAAINAPTMSLAGLSGDIIRRDANDGAHMMVKDHPISHQLWLMDPMSGAMPLTAVIPLDAAAPQRIDAALRFWRFTAHGRPRLSAHSFRRVDRLTAAMRALDARMAGASYRMIANVLFDPCRIASEPWKTAPLRDTVIRLARVGAAMMRGGYRDLLGPCLRE